MTDFNEDNSIVMIEEEQENLNIWEYEEEDIHERINYKISRRDRDDGYC